MVLFSHTFSTFSSLLHYLKNLVVFVLGMYWPPVVLSNSEEVTEPSNSVGEISLNIASGNDKEIVQLPTDIDKDVDDKIYKKI